jgi:DNA-directed RNA polymerase subunit alpha
MMNTQESIIARVVKSEASTDTHGIYTLQPLERGFGTTIGNALRRVLLTSIPGAAISSIKIEGVLHEFSTIPGVKEDVAEIILNLKQVRFKLIDPKPDKVTLHLKGEHEFVAGDIGKDTNQFIILNPDLHIATLNEKADLHIELKISSGTGWVPAEKNKTNDYPIGTIFIDSIFSPITNVAMRVENLPGTAREVLEQLTLEVKTDGSITPDAALEIACKTLQNYFGLFLRRDSKPVEYQREIQSEDILKIRSLLQRSVDEMELSVRAYNCLRANNIRTIGDLVRREESEMLRFKNFGRKSLNELMAKLKSLGLEFGMDVDRYLIEKVE